MLVCLSPSHDKGGVLIVTLAKMFNESDIPGLHCCNTHDCQGKQHICQRVVMYASYCRLLKSLPELSKDVHSSEEDSEGKGSRA